MHTDKISKTDPGPGHVPDLLCPSPVMLPRLLPFLIPGLLLLALVTDSCGPDRAESDHALTYCNPLNLDYRYQPDTPSRREAADPTVILFRDRYYLFASKSGGYWWSDDLCSWNLVHSPDLPLEDYAPTAVVIGDTVFFMASSASRAPVFKSADPLSGSWQRACDSFAFPVWDPALFLDDDGRLYLYWGCSNSRPIYGIGVDYRNGFRPTGERGELIRSDTQIHGWERPGDRNELDRAPWIEGAWMNKHDGVYHLQYAAPGTEFKTYADGVYTSDHPLGPFRYADHNPFSLKAGGFSCGAGHGSTFRDRYGNLWHIATVSISVNHIFERRLALFPAWFDGENRLHALTAFGDYPVLLPGRKTRDAGQLLTGWMLLSVNKPVRASSSLEDHPPSRAVDEDIRTCWSAQGASAEEWLILDLEREYPVRAIQVNFADVENDRFARDTGFICRYALDRSLDGSSWEAIRDRSGSVVRTGDKPHDYLEPEYPVTARFLRIRNISFPGSHFALSGFRVFGTGNYQKPGVVNSVRISRDQTDRTRVRISWPPSPLATGYSLRYGTDRGVPGHQHLVYGDTTLEVGSLNADCAYYFTLDAFNENGISPSSTVVKIE